MCPFCFVGVGRWTDSFLIFLHVFSARPHLCFSRSCTLMTRWMPAQSTAFVEPGESSPQACSTGVGASTTTMDGVDLVAWKMTTVIARKTLVALLLEFNSSWSWWLCFGLVPCPPLVSSCWRSPVCFASVTMSKRWALILITTLHPRLTLWEKSLSHHPKPTPLWPQNLRQQPEHESCMSIGQLRGSESTGSCWQLLVAVWWRLVEGEKWSFSLKRVPPVCEITL